MMLSMRVTEDNKKNVKYTSENQQLINKEIEVSNAIARQVGKMQVLLLTSKLFGNGKMAKMFTKICHSIHENSTDLSEENKELSEHIRQTAEILLQRSKEEDIDLGESRYFLI